MASLESKTRVIGKSEPKKNLAWLYSWVGGKLRRGKIPEEAFHVRKKDMPFIGGVFIYSYDPKTKDTLPWWDELPVVIPIGLYNDGWLGLNVHYLPPSLRAKLLDKLLQFKKRAHTSRAYMKVSYEFLQSVVKAELFQPCVKRYLFSHVTSPLLYVNDEHWENIVKLPLQQFRYANAQKVWHNPNGPKKRKRR